MTTETIIQNDPPPVDPAVIANVDPAIPPPAPVADPPAPVDPPPAPIAADPPAPAPDPNAHGNKGKKPWFLDRISEETHARQEAQRERDEWKALAERLRTGAADPAKPATPPAAANEADVETRAQQIADERVARSQISTVIAAGVKDFTDWDHRAETLAAVGAATPAFVMDVVAVDPQNAHKILHALSEDPDKAARLAKMDVRGRTAELTRMSMAAATPAPKADPEPPKPAPKAVSKAPPPPPAIEPGAAQTIEWWSDKASDDQFSKGWEARQRERANRGRR